VHRSDEVNGTAESNRENTMHLILWRHAEAEKAVPDKARNLTPNGEEQARRMATWLGRHLPAGVRIWVSPARRTRQTADTLKLPYEIVEALYGPVDCEALLQQADWPEGATDTLIVGHQPTLGELAAQVMTGRGESWDLPTGGIWWFDCSPLTGNAIVRAVLSPTWL
jgi:phosphohistidine phosphatase